VNRSALYVPGEPDNVLKGATVLMVEGIEYNVGGMTVQVFWHFNAGNEMIATFGGSAYAIASAGSGGASGTMDWRKYGGMRPSATANADAADGDILVTAVAAAAAVGGSYDITLYIKAK